MPSTHENLKEAFAGESQAHQKYRAFAKKAEQEGFAAIARLFRLTAEAERIHAEGHLKSLDGVASTAENLQAAESRISDVDVSTEMTEFVRNQILSQAAVAMLSQANALPQNVLTLLQ